MNKKLENFYIFLSGALGALAFAPLYLWLCFVVSLSILFVLIWRTRTRKEALYSGFFWGIGFHIASLYWIGNALIIEPEKFILAFAYCKYRFPNFS